MKSIQPLETCTNQKKSQLSKNWKKQHLSLTVQDPEKTLLSRLLHDQQHWRL